MEKRQQKTSNFSRSFFINHENQYLQLIKNHKSEYNDHVIRCKTKVEEVEGPFKKKTIKTPWERDYVLAETRDVFAEYLEMIIQV